ncbi:hypothetical protein B0H15DRAFT_384472 [Mycena belliarum]|uniref:C2H2-type domain-containing protein n=1 Tax=Mycena belliarum TaxID=1033014 RepID=A0AAD6XQ17_9AGAR|nr:hypothetical protein B0H15DRAFT_384472 [Mycena belliae]
MSTGMSRSPSMQPLPKAMPDNGAMCEICGLYLRRNTDLPRHMLLHSKDKHSLMFTCPVDGCGHQTLQKSNLATHIRTHTRAKPHKCNEVLPNKQRCDFSTADPSSLHRHRKRKHGYTSRPRLPSFPRGPYVRRASPQTASELEAEGDGVSEYESEESVGRRAGGSGSHESQARAEGPEIADDIDGDAYMDADGDADADADADADGEPDPEVEMAPPPPIENVSAERTAPPPEPPTIGYLPSEHPSGSDQNSSLELSPSTIPLALDPVLANISNTRTDASIAAFDAR